MTAATLGALFVLAVIALLAGCVVEIIDDIRRSRRRAARRRHPSSQLSRRVEASYASSASPNRWVDVTTVHAAPSAGDAFMPCCRRTPFSVPRSDRMTLDPYLVTCGRGWPVDRGAAVLDAAIAETARQTEASS